MFEYLKMQGKKRGLKKQRLSLWRKRDIQRSVKEMAARAGIRVSYICAVNTSCLAYDGSGKVARGKDAGFTVSVVRQPSIRDILGPDAMGSPAYNLVFRRGGFKSIIAQQGNDDIYFRHIVYERGNPIRIENANFIHFFPFSPSLMRRVLPLFQRNHFTPEWTKADLFLLYE